MNTDGNLAALHAYQRTVDADEAYEAALEAITHEIWHNKIKLADAILDAGEGDIDVAVRSAAIQIQQDRSEADEEAWAEDRQQQQERYA